MTDYSKITALYSRLSVGDEDRDGGESNSIQNQKIFLENYARFFLSQENVQNERAAGIADTVQRGLGTLAPTSKFAKIAPEGKSRK